MNHRTTERGQALILIALAAIGLFAFSALAIDGSRSFSNKRHAQNAADTAALTAALKYVRSGGDFNAAVLEAQRLATDNGYTSDIIPLASGTPNTKVSVNLCSQEGQVDPVTGLKYTPCEGIDTAHKSEYIRVRIVSTIPSTFGRVIGRQTFTTAAEATARVKGSVTSSSGSLSHGAAMVQTNDQNKDQCFLFNGNATLTTHDSGIFVNCKGNAALYQNGSTVYTMGADSYVVGCKGGNNGTYVGGTINCNSTPLHVDATTYASIPTMPAKPTCSGDGGASGGDYDLNNGNLTVKDGTVTATQGRFGNIIVNKGTLVFSSGTYCVSGNLNVNGQGSIRGNSGTVKVVMASADFNVGASNNFTFNDLEIYTGNNDFNIQGTLNAGRLRFYSNSNTLGQGNLIINSGSTLKSGNAYFYLNRGTIRWNGSTTVELTAPPDGDPYVGGVVMHMPWENTSSAELNGGSSCLIYGTFLMPHSKVTFNGGTNFELHSQVIAYEYILDGNGEIEIYYLANPLLNPPSVTNPEIQLAQ